MQHAHPEVIGHMDLCLLYTPSLCLQDYPEAWLRLERNVRFAVEYGALIEVNAAAFRKGWKTAYPKEEVLKVRPRSPVAVHFLILAA